LDGGWFGIARFGNSAQERGRKTQIGESYAIWSLANRAGITGPVVVGHFIVSQCFAARRRTWRDLPIIPLDGGLRGNVVSVIARKVNEADTFWQIAVSNVSNLTPRIDGASRPKPDRLTQQKSNQTVIDGWTSCGEERKPLD
jgi:hypothetical protein